MSKYIVGGHWTTAPEGWTVLTEAQCDLTAPLPWADDSVDAIFSEHVVEHLSMTDAILFFKRAKSVLKLGGVLRTVCPFIDKMVTFQEDTPMGRHYAQVQLKSYYPAEEVALAELGIQLTDHGHEFMMDSLLKKHNHKHVWSTNLMNRVLARIGFSQVDIIRPGLGFASMAKERIRRGVDTAYAINNGFTYYDPESMVVEAIK